MRNLIREKLEAGETPEQIQAYFVEKYGEWILLSPKPQGVNLLVWVLPPLFLVIGGVVVGITVRQWAKTGKHLRPSTPPSPEAPSRTTPGESRYVEQLRRELDEYE
ncbi:MAG: cytochrome c-type biogenesis protein CcmH [Nitrospinota bacterium]|nr:MAG: cytochrome c-type biogenesis protein CcmH [Nitrospinota bacterium]